MCNKKSFYNKLFKTCASELSFNMYSLHNLLCTPINEYSCAKPTMFVTSDAINIQHNTSANRKSSLFIIINIQQSTLFMYRRQKSGWFFFVISFRIFAFGRLQQCLVQTQPTDSKMNYWWVRMRVLRVCVCIENLLVSLRNLSYHAWDSVSLKAYVGFSNQRLLNFFSTSS